MEFVSSLRGLVLVVDCFLEPSDQFVRHLCAALVATEHRVVLASADVPRHRLTGLPHDVHIVDCYLASVRDVELGNGGALVVHSVTRAVLRDGVASVLTVLLEVCDNRARDCAWGEVLM